MPLGLLAASFALVAIGAAAPGVMLFFMCLFTAAIRVRQSIAYFAENKEQLIDQSPEVDFSSSRPKIDDIFVADPCNPCDYRSIWKP